jgi:hydrogenase nickel incorporation protein HypA/HybF
MHEYSLMRGLLKQVDEMRCQNRADYVVSIKLTVGEFSGIEADLMTSAFEELSLGTALEGASLELTRTSLAARCMNCDADFPIQNYRFICPACGSVSVTICQGEELLLESVTMGCGEMEEP